MPEFALRRWEQAKFVEALGLLQATIVGYADGSSITQ